MDEPLVTIGEYRLEEMGAAETALVKIHNYAVAEREEALRQKALAEKDSRSDFALRGSLAVLDAVLDIIRDVEFAQDAIDGYNDSMAAWGDAIAYEIEHDL